MKTTSKRLLAGIVLAISLTLVACGGEDPVKVPDSFPRKQLIEHFTSQSCGYCPDGIKALEEVAKGNSQYVWVSHHAGFADDIYTIKGSKQITRKYGITSAPSMMLNRTSVKTPEGTLRVFHPGYLASVTGQVEKTAIASVVISNNYDPNNGTLKVKVTGQCADQQITSLYLTVLIKESGLTSAQSDYTNTFEGWQEFVHTNVVREFLTNSLGDEVAITRQSYEKELELTLPEKWKAENCMVVAYLTDSRLEPIINAEQEPVVSGTKGGEDIEGGGKTIVPVTDDYPEDGAPIEDAEYTQGIYALTQKVTGGNIFVIQVSNPTLSLEDGNSFPLAQIYLAAAADTIPYGTYDFVSPDAFGLGKALQGYRNDAEFNLGGSMLYYINKPYYDQSGRLSPNKEWLMDSGTITIDAEGVSYDITTRNQSKSKGTYKGQLTKVQG